MGFVCGVERVCEGEPGAECFVVGRLDAYIMGFECCGTSKERDVRKVRALGEFVKRQPKISRARSYFSGMSYCGKKGRLRLCIKRSLIRAQRQVSDDRQRDCYSKVVLTVLAQRALLRAVLRACKYN